MEPSFNELEQRVLRFLEKEFLKKGGKPTTMRDPAMWERDVMEKCGLDQRQYREVMARFEHHMIAKAIAIGAINGHVHVYPAIVDIVHQLDEWAQQIKASGEQPNRIDQTKRYFFARWWFAVIVVALIVLTAIGTCLSNLAAILKWFGRQS